MELIKIGKGIVDRIKNIDIINIDSISLKKLSELIKYIMSDKVLDTSNIEGIDKIIITPVFSFSESSESLIIKKDEYPKFDDLISKLKINKYSYCSNYTIIEFYKDTELIIKGYLEFFKSDETWNAIHQVNKYISKNKSYD